MRRINFEVATMAAVLEIIDREDLENEFQEPLELESEYVLRYWKHVKTELSIHHEIEDSDLEKIEKALDLNEYTLISIQV